MCDKSDQECTEKTAEVWKQNDKRNQQTKTKTALRQIERKYAYAVLTLVYLMFSLGYVLPALMFTTTAGWALVGTIYLLTMPAVVHIIYSRYKIGL